LKDALPPRLTHNPAHDQPEDQDGDHHEGQAVFHNGIKRQDFAGVTLVNPDGERSIKFWLAAGLAVVLTILFGTAVAWWWNAHGLR